MRADLSPRRDVRLGAALTVVLLHIVMVLALVRAFAPESAARFADVLGAVQVTVMTSPPEPPASPASDPTPRAAEPRGAAAEVGKRSVPKPVAAPSPRIAIATQPAPPVAGRGNDATSGARDWGTGSGAGGQGAGTGAGADGSGTGGGAATKAVKIAGDINSTRDYPAATREQRRGDHVIIALTIGTDGRVKNCRIHRASRDPQSDQITCRLATKRFRFRPATDGAGNPITSIYGWQQRWFDPKEN